MTTGSETGKRYWIGCDVGSTAVKTAVIATDGMAVLARRYRRHHTRQSATVVALLDELAAEIPDLLARSALFFTGSGGRNLAERAGAAFVQEVNAVALATERLHPTAGSIVDIGGQDAKLIVWNRDPLSGRSRKTFSMNDKCAGGTGSVIDRILTKLGIPAAEAGAIHFAEERIHPVAARCGVFAETDINGLQKQGLPPQDLLVSLFAAIVQQNLSVLTRGATLEPPVLLLGGPHEFMPGLVDAWRNALRKLWTERGRVLPGDLTSAVRVPPDACFFPAVGAVLFGVNQDLDRLASRPDAQAGREALARRVRVTAATSGLPGLLQDAAEREEIRALARQEEPYGFDGSLTSSTLDVVIGLDAGSTSTKAVLCDLTGRLLAKSYRLSAGDPLADAQIVLADLERQAIAAGCALRVRGFGTTGYAKDLLGQLLGADLILVETVAHARSAMAVDPHCDVIADIGGQDIKVLVLRNGRVRDFRLNSQCSAGNGYFLQSTAARFGIPLEQYADHAFRAERCPRFNFGCAVFLEADISNFQQLGWEPEEVLAGLARVLPQNVWLYVVGEPNLARLGRSFLLQGGTQRNEAAVKAEVDFIRERVAGARIRVHPHAGEAGALGVALEMLQSGRLSARSSFIGFGAVADLRPRTRQDESTRCTRCPNRCARTVIEAELSSGEIRRYVIATCDLGRELEDSPRIARSKAAAADPVMRPKTTVTNPAARLKTAAPDFAARAARIAFAPVPTVPVIAERDGRPSLRTIWRPNNRRARELRESVRIGFPRAVNLYQAAPYFSAYLQALGIAPTRIVFSAPTGEKLYREGSRRGAIDGCYPSKVAQAHVHNLLYHQPVDWIVFPILVNMPEELRGAIDASICPTSQSTPAVVRAAFTREGDAFAERGVRFFTPVFHLAEAELFAREMLRFWGPRLGVTASENRLALAAAAEAAANLWQTALRRPALETLRMLQRERRVGIVVLGRPYHNDPGLNHGIFRDLNRRGYPIFCIASLPRDRATLGEWFGEDLARGWISDPLEIMDVWKNSFSANSNAKLWAAKLVARHPNLVGLDVSNFRCGHDAPIHSTVEAIIEAAGRPYFAFHEIDENRPSGAIRLRVETIDYFLQDYVRRTLRREASPAAPVEAAAELLEQVLD